VEAAELSGIVRIKILFDVLEGDHLKGTLLGNDFPMVPSKQQNIS
jgi:hypothetical protein